jgi:hypothetical protein
VLTTADISIAQGLWLEVKERSPFPRVVSTDPVRHTSTITCNNTMWKGIYYMTKETAYSGILAHRIVEGWQHLPRIH